MKTRILLGTLGLSLSLSGQTPKIDFYSAADLARMEQGYRNKVDPNTGSAGQVLEHYPNHLTMLILRERDGQSELHENVADVFIVVDGHAELWTGGRMVDAKETDKGEQRGSGLSGATHIALQKGDIVHIPAGVPHQLRIAKGASFTYFVVKANVKE